MVNNDEYDFYSLVSLRYSQDGVFGSTFLLCSVFVHSYNLAICMYDLSVVASYYFSLAIIPSVAEGLKGESKIEFLL